MPLTTPAAFTDGTLYQIDDKRWTAAQAADDAKYDLNSALAKAGGPIRKYVLSRIRRGCGNAWWACSQSVTVKVGVTTDRRKKEAYPFVEVSLHGYRNVSLRVHWGASGEETLDAWLDRVIVAWKALNG